jgi:hypothetical protein
MKFSALPALFVAALSSAPVFAESFKPGEYTLTLYSGPTQEKVGEVCLRFVRTGETLFRDSGAWSSVDQQADWSGNYAVSGNLLRVYGTYPDGSGGMTAIDFFMDQRNGEGGFDQWTVSLAPIQPIADGRIALDVGCVPGHARM